eukprot:GHVT01100760.1.p1 GENE.GHVT01100760.1~~GHVT01100760.1.p1  ORF type:complete len:252 (-),score=14.97 GHVT01100760.1:366-1121(-)
MNVLLLTLHATWVSEGCYPFLIGVVFTAGWDRVLKAWDLRMPQPVAQCMLHGKAFAMDMTNDGSRLVVGDSMKRTYIFDLRKGPAAALQSPEMRDQILKFQLRCISCFPDNQGFTASSIEGRVAWEFFDTDPVVQAKRYAFKCHRIKETDGKETVCPVNALAFHPRFGTFATGGSDGGVSVWDGYSKKRLWRLPLYQTGVAALAFSSQGSQLAIAVSYGFEKGPADPAESSPPSIVIRSIKDDDVKPKAAA